MYIQEFKCIQWRNLEKIHIELPDHLIVIQGENAQGKTNLLEAIYFLSRGVSFRKAKDQEIITWGASYSYLSARIRENNSYFHKEVSVKSGQKKEWRVNGHPSRGRKGIWVVGYFPEDSGIVEGPPQNRREFIDSAVGFIYPAHATLVNQYERLLTRRNLLLREQASDDLIATYTNKLINIGKKVIKGRLEYLKLYSPFLKGYYSRLGMNKQNLSVRYQSIGYQITEGLNIQLEDGFNAVRSEEREREMTLVGPHRDDVIFEKDGYEFRAFGSQGEKKSLALSIKLAEMSMIQLVEKTQAIAILDDVFSELDSVHQDLLLKEILGQKQVFISTTLDKTDWYRSHNEKVMVLRVESGKIKEK